MIYGKSKTRKISPALRWALSAITTLACVGWTVRAKNALSSVLPNTIERSQERQVPQLLDDKNTISVPQGLEAPANAISVRVTPAAIDVNRAAASSEGKEVAPAYRKMNGPDIAKASLHSAVHLITAFHAANRYAPSSAIVLTPTIGTGGTRVQIDLGFIVEMRFEGVRCGMIAEMSGYAGLCGGQTKG